MTEDAKEQAAETESIANHIGRLLEGVGIDLSREELVYLVPFYERDLERLAVLHAADLDDEEVAGLFAPIWPPEQETTR